MNKCINELKISFSAHSENEAFARACVSAFITPLDPYVSELAELKTAVSEAVTNCIVHGYRNRRDGVIYMHMKIFSDRRVYIKIRDKGCGIPDIEQAMQPLFTTAPEEERAGLGFAVMQSFTDRLRVKSSSGNGTSLVMEKVMGNAKQ
jgi:stage II sporulation protein AB (anti-sigma F factor)